MKAFRIKPGQDLWECIQEEALKNSPVGVAIVTCVGSLKVCKVRLAGATPTNQNMKVFQGPLEIVSLVGTVIQDRAHIHISVSDQNGNVFGGHLVPGSIVDTTAEVVLADFTNPQYQYTRELDSETGFRELVVRKVE